MRVATHKLVLYEGVKWTLCGIEVKATPGLKATVDNRKINCAKCVKRWNNKETLTQGGRVKSKPAHEAKTHRELAELIWMLAVEPCYPRIWPQAMDKEAALQAIERILKNEETHV